MKKHKITVKNKTGNPLSGAGTELTLDGEELRGVKSFNLNISARGMAVATLEMYVDYEMVDVEIGRVDCKEVKNA